MPDPRKRCVSLTDDASRRLLAGATRLVLPLRLRGTKKEDYEVLLVQMCPHLPPYADDPRRFYMEYQLRGSGGPAKKIWMRSFIAPGELMIGREAWKIVGIYLDNAQLTVAYRVGGIKVFDGVPELCGRYFAKVDGWNLARWRGPQHMPAALARHRKLVTAVDVMPVREIPEATWVEAGFVANRSVNSFGEVDWCQSAREYAHEQWKADHGPGSWERDWGWVIGMEVEP